MKRIFLLLAISIITGTIISCGNGSGSDSDTGYVDPGLTTTKTQALKSYTFTDLTMSSFSCSSSKSCGAIIFTGELNDVYYTGFAVDNYLSGSSKFALKIYWNASSIASINTASYSIKAIVVGTTYTTASGNLDVTITSELDSNSVTRYLIKFNSPITFGTYTIAANDTIYAYKYPE